MAAEYYVIVGKDGNFVDVEFYNPDSISNAIELVKYGGKLVCYPLPGYQYLEYGKEEAIELLEFVLERGY